jgi:hypothetical protein
MIHTITNPREAKGQANDRVRMKFAGEEHSSSRAPRSELRKFPAMKSQMKLLMRTLTLLAMSSTSNAVHLRA